MSRITDVAIFEEQIKNKACTICYARAGDRGVCKKCIKSRHKTGWRLHNNYRETSHETPLP